MRFWDRLMGKPELYTVELYKDISGAWRFRVRHQNGQNIASSNEAYSSKSACSDSARNMARDAGWSVVELDSHGNRPGETQSKA